MTIMRGFDEDKSGAIDGWYEVSGAGVGPQGSTSFTCCAVARATATSDAYNGQHFMGFNISAGQGFVIWHLNTTTRFRIYDGGGVGTDAPIYVHSYPASIGKDFVFHGTYDGATVHFYVNGVEVGAGNPSAGGYTAPTLGNIYSQGAASGADGIYSFGLAGCSVTNSVLTGAQVLSHYQSIVSAGYPVALPSATYFWNVMTGCPTAGATWTGDIGATNLLRTGSNQSALYTQRVTPNWY
jgi:hypothetical protein